ncbi:uncharacterized protein PAC_19730 [Phialocephala subalpina]|uniref:Heterokaryon incompatibility domain-containing protein n=1 Tax=Phialocephala subalpina TaxID=576137 RepID=A0A1L7XXU3_9HELO|nr:uncharacterized protein PAC_19730 [Phialocephala subalpina]
MIGPLRCILPFDDFGSLAAVRPNVPFPGNPYPQETSINEVLWRTLVGNRDLQGRVAPASFSRLPEIHWKACGVSSDFTGKDAHTVQMIRLPIFNSVRSVCQECQIDGRDFQSYFPPQRDVGFEMTIGLEDALTRVENALTGRRLMTTTEGYLGLAIREARQGDLVAILYGCSCPVILRRRGDGTFHFVGEAYMHGIMDGEAMDRLQAGKYQSETFTIK